MVGSRRGFCGDFNERLHRRWRTETTDTGASTASTIAVGHKLCLRLAEDRAPVLRLDGADVAEEIPAVLAAVVKELGVQQAERGLVTLTVLWHRDPGAEPVLQNLLPPFDAYRGAEPTHGFAPVLNLAPRTFLLGLVEQYLFAALHTVLFESLLAENEQRVRHLDGAVRHLEEREETLERRIRALRQEEIIEEIEVILLNAAGPDERSAG